MTVDESSPLAPANAAPASAAPSNAAPATTTPANADASVVDPAPTQAETAGVTPGGDGWQALPPRARSLFTISALVSALVIAVVALIPIGLLVSSKPLAIALAVATLVVVPTLLVWSARRRYANTRWRIDAQGFALRRGYLWHSDTRVPGSRVQHLDITRGPIERRFDLSTLIIHTAGTRHSAVSIGGLDTACAEQLRDQLAQRIETDDDDD